MWKKLLIISLISVILTSCSLFTGRDNQDYSKLYFDFNLTELASDRNAEYSSLCWYQDKLILLPQYPSYFRSKIDEDVIFMLTKDQLSKAIKRKGKAILEVSKIQVVNNETYKLLPGYEGFEGICYDGNYFYLSVEFNSSTQKGLVVKAQLSQDNKKLEILNDQHIILDLPANVFNASYESISSYNNDIYLIYEANGINVNNNAIVKKISSDLTKVEDVKFAAIEYRITDITAFDETGRAWAINYFWPGDASHYNPDEDNIPNSFPQTNNIEYGVERIIPLIINDNEIKYDTSRDPIYIKKEARDVSYNWEGIVKYDNNSFILATDKFPKTVLRYLKK
jgi:hypothetical protein